MQEYISEKSRFTFEERRIEISLKPKAQGLKLAVIWKEQW